MRKQGKQVNHGEISREVNKLYEDDPMRYCHGKSVIKRLRGKIREEIKTGVNLYKSTEFIEDDALVEIRSSIWPNKNAIKKLMEDRK